MGALFANFTPWELFAVTTDYTSLECKVILSSYHRFSLFPCTICKASKANGRYLLQAHCVTVNEIAQAHIPPKRMLNDARFATRERTLCGHIFSRVLYRAIIFAWLMVFLYFRDFVNRVSDRESCSVLYSHVVVHVPSYNTYNSKNVKADVAVSPTCFPFDS